MGSAFFVTGTDTGVGKTTVTASILALAVETGLRAAALKPVETGCSAIDGQLVGADAALLASVTGQKREEVGLFCYREPLAPNVAAARDGVALPSLRTTSAAVASFKRAHELLLVEGAGGLMVPMGDGQVIADWIRELALPLIIVGRAGLGTINHCLLTVKAAQRTGIDVAGLILCAHDDAEYRAAPSNQEQIALHCSARLLGVFPPSPVVPNPVGARQLDLSGII